ncbi:MAG: gliding motility-associated C-terminal domain-containing protein [Ferruginibacter sp.]|nr:gliding motility-associated C-terminal domain-containing protein [Ferruginibacter sp.]
MFKFICLIIPLLLLLQKNGFSQSPGLLKSGALLNLLNRNRQRVGREDIKNYLLKDKSNTVNARQTTKAIAPGLHKNVRQINSSIGQKNNGYACLDTSLRLTYDKGTVWLSNDPITKTRDGNILIPGFDYDAATNKTNAHLIKCNQRGDTIWSKSIEGGFAGLFMDVYKAFELADNSIILVGNISVPMPYNGREDPLMIRLTPKGNVLWQKTFETKIWSPDTTSGSVDIIDCKQDGHGDLYFCGDIRYGATVRSTLAFKMGLNGNVLWSNSFESWNYGILSGINIVGPKITFTGHIMAGDFLVPMAAVMDAATGDSLYTTGYGSPANDIWHAFYADNMVKLNNGHLVLYGTGFFQVNNSDPLRSNTNYGLIELTEGLDFVRSVLFRSPQTNTFYGSGFTIFEDGSGAYTSNKYVNANKSDVLYGTIQDGRIKRERVSLYQQGIVFSSNYVKMDDGGFITTNFLANPSISQNYIEFVKLHNSDTSGSCLGSDSLITYTESQFFTKQPVAFDSLVTNVFTENHRAFKGVFNNAFTIASNCKQISFCDSFKLAAKKDTVCAGSVISISINKNKECGSIPLWTYDSSVVASFYKLNDTTVNVEFNNTWQGYIKATINGCTVLQDSVHFTVLQSPASLYIGPDTIICPGNIIRLNAKTGYASYTWQDGSPDSTFSVTKPGKYYVTTTNACGGIYTDTILVAGHAAIPFDAGNNMELCMNDTTVLIATPGFIHYQWTNYNIINDTTQTVQVFPLVSAWYKVVAEKIPGCFVTDSVFVTVKNTPKIHLGNDTSICANQILILDAGPGFTSYSWNTGEQTERIIASKALSYNVKATLNGCTTFATLRVLNINPLPAFTLGNDTSLCQGKQLQFTFNLPQALYKWSTGSQANMFTVTQAGNYWLQVTEQGCSKSDTVNIKYGAAPVINLGTDTALCQQQTLLLQATNAGATYLWQDGSTREGFIVKKAGLYYVTATIGNCTGGDSIKIIYKVPPYFTLGKDSFLCTGQPYTLSPLLNTPSTYLWQDGSTDAIYKVVKEGLYSLTAANECGSFKASVIITTGYCDIWMPSAFTPNGDGSNDIFKVKYPFPTKHFSLVIYNRWGQKVFESNDITNGWDGRYKGELQVQNAYVWAINFLDINNKKIFFKGTVMLLR